MNPIVRMMKRCIKMPLKYALPLLFIGALVLASTTGCTSNTSPTATPITQPTQQPQASISGNAPSPEPTLGSWNAAFSKAGYEIGKPFVESFDKSDKGIISGVVKDGSDKLKPYNYTITVERVTTRDQAKAAFNAAITKAQQQGYQSGSVNIDPDRSWSGYLGNQGFQSDKIVRIHIEEPDTLWTQVWDPFVIVPESHAMYYVETTYSTTI